MNLTTTDVATTYPCHKTPETSRKSLRRELLLMDQVTAKHQFCVAAGITWRGHRKKAASHARSFIMK